MQPKPAIALFARAPIPGQVKTRLIGRFTPEQACDLHRAFVRDMWEMLVAFSAQAELFLYTDQEEKEWRALAGPRVRLQRGGDLGKRMLRCFEEMQADGLGPLLILGSDSPALPPAFIAPWSERLTCVTALLGPAEDGGYYAIGCRTPHPRMFEGVNWSTRQTFAQTESALRRCGFQPAYLPMYYDVDTFEDLCRLSAESHLPPHTRRWLGKNFGV